MMQVRWEVLEIICAFVWIKLSVIYRTSNGVAPFMEQ